MDRLPVSGRFCTVLFVVITVPLGCALCLKAVCSPEQVLEALRERYHVVALDLRAAEGVQACDLLGPRDEIRPFFTGADAVVHMAFVPPPSGVSSATTGPGHDSDGGSSADGANDQLFAAEHLNVQMAYNVFQTASEEGVRRVVMASSNHAADYFEELILDRQYDMVDPDAVARSDNYYGWAKIAYENLGFMFATGKMHGGRQLENVQIRIGGPRETDVAACEKGNLRQLRRALGAYMSKRDLQQMVVKCIETENITTEYGVPFQIFYGISGNDHAFWSIANARKIIGYEPEDNSAIRFGTIATLSTGTAHPRVCRLLDACFCSRRYFRPRGSGQRRLETVSGFLK